MIIGLNLLLSTLAFSILATWYFWPWIKKQPKEIALQILIWPHVFRHIGMMFLASGAVKTTLPEVFSIPAAFGDLTAAGLAFVALLAIRRKAVFAITSVWIFNIWGTADLLYAVTIGTINQADQSMGATFWIPAVIVPALLVSHTMIFLLLTKQAKTKL
jgi:hypothetical protein